jgi:UPF0755 protein
MRSARSKALLVFLATATLGVLVVCAVIYNVWSYPDTPDGTARGKIVIDIPKGAGVPQVAQILVRAGLLEQPTLFRLYAGQRKVASRMRAGQYEMDAPLTPRQLIDILSRGVKDKLVAVTIPEGKNLLEVAALFDRAGVAPQQALLARATNSGFLRGLRVSGPSLEGYLFPDTYRLRPGTDPAHVLTTLVRRHRQVFAELNAAYPRGLKSLRDKLKFTVSDVVTLASIVEKETGRPAERPRIAQVFVNRLSFPAFDPKLLQTDPTITYGCIVAPIFLEKTSDACRRWEGTIRTRHLRDAQNPYNTYVHSGLPPGPICNPGRAALKAVLHPDGSPYLYFVSKNDGTHQFSTTRAAHETAVVIYQRGGKPLQGGAQP